MGYAVLIVDTSKVPEGALLSAEMVAVELDGGGFHITRNRYGGVTRERGIEPVEAGQLAWRANDLVRIFEGQRGQ
jgi:hypothetical protein